MGISIHVSKITKWGKSDSSDRIGLSPGVCHMSSADLRGVSYRSWSSGLIFGQVSELYSEELAQSWDLVRFFQTPVPNVHSPHHPSHSAFC